MDELEIGKAELWPILAVCECSGDAPNYCTGQLCWDTCMQWQCEHLSLEPEEGYIVERPNDA